MERWRLIINGLVQGVGFRPFLYNLARKNGLTGWVRNNSAGVEVEVEGGIPNLLRFSDGIREEAPAAAQIETRPAGRIRI